MKERDILSLIQGDPWMMKVLVLAKSLNLPDWMIGAGFVRNKVWDYLHGYNNIETQNHDVDLIYFDQFNNDEEKDLELSKKLNKETGINWEIVNQAYTHKWHNRGQYKNSTEALADWTETATCVAVSIDENNILKLHSPLGIDDLVGLVVRKNERCSDPGVYIRRACDKKWLTKWPKLKIIY